MPIQPYNRAHEHDLNILFNGLGVNKVSVVSLTTLINTYGPESPNELAQLINQHSKLSLGQIAKKCYQLQGTYDLNGTYTLADMIAYTWNLFVVNTLKGFDKEKKAREYLSGVFAETDIQLGNKPEVDVDYAVDFYAGKGRTMYAGVQVKPTSYKTTTAEVKRANQEKNAAFQARFDAPVVYLYYTPRGAFENMKEVLATIQFHAARKT